MTCQHHYVIETPNGPTAQGTCKLCGDEKSFRTSSDERWEMITAGPERLRKGRTPFECKCGERVAWSQKGAHRARNEGCRI